MPAPLQVAFLTGDPAAASARVRVGDALPGLARAGIEGRLVALPRAWNARRRLIHGLARDDVVVLHRRLLDRVLLRALRRAARALVLDLDDAIWTRPGGRSRRLEGRFARTLAAADLVTVGSAWLARAAGGHPRVRTIPPVPPPAPDVPPAPPDGLLHLVWTGSRPTLPYLEAIGPDLAGLARERGGWVLDVIADAPPALPGVPHRVHPWSLEGEAALLARGAIGLYPLPRDPWSEGKCAYKVRLYLRHGLPVATVAHGGGEEAAGAAGVVVPAGQPGAWRAALRALLDDPDGRARRGALARQLALRRDDPAGRDAALGAALHESRAFTARGGPC